MLSLLKIKNIALIDEIELEFARGLNLLTGETGSGKSIIVDSLSALTGERVSSDLIKQGTTNAYVEGLFAIKPTRDLLEIFGECGVELDDEEDAEVIVRRELALTGKNRIFVNNQLVTQAFLRKIGTFLVDIHGQGEQATLFNNLTHLEMLDEYAKLEDLRKTVAENYRRWSNVQAELKILRENESEKLQLLDILRFQVEEIANANLQEGEDERLDEEKRRLNNVEKLSTLSEESYALLYENEEAVVTTLERISRRINELAEYESSFRDYQESLQSAHAVLEDLAFSVRDFRSGLEFSPERLSEIENRLAEISRLKRKYGGTIEGVLQHLAESSERLNNIETSEIREEALRKKLIQLREDYLKSAREIHERRIKAKKEFEVKIEASLRDVSLEKARFVVHFDGSEEDEKFFTARGFDNIEFHFSANVGESVRPIAKVASGGELSRLMLVLNTATKISEVAKTMVFDEIDTGIGGRVAEAVGLKLKQLSKTHQVLCVTHQPQVASLADHHFKVEKATLKDKTHVSVHELSPNEQIEEIARMMTGKEITETARQHAREMISATR